MKLPTLDALRRHAAARTLRRPATLPVAIRRLGFVQADPIRAPARAQDLILRHRVDGYRAGDLERRYARLAIEEDHFVNYGFLPRAHLALMHPRGGLRAWPAAQRRHAQDVLAFVAERGQVHPRDVQAAFEHGRTRNAWGGTSNAITHLLDAMHYRGWLRVARREAGQRIYARAAHPPPDGRSDADRADALLDLAVALYAPLPQRTLGVLCSFLQGGAPHLTGELRRAKQRAQLRLPSAEVDGTRWYWPAGESPASLRWTDEDELRLLAPFDPIVWDRERFERLWGWAYRFEAYTPAARRTLGYYALPMLWRHHVIGWANVDRGNGTVRIATGFVSGAPPADAAFAQALERETARLHAFLGAAGPPCPGPREDTSGEDRDAAVHPAHSGPS